MLFSLQAGDFIGNKDKETQLNWVKLLLNHTRNRHRAAKALPMPREYPLGTCNVQYGMECARLSHPGTCDNHGDKTGRGSRRCRPSTLRSFYGAETLLITRKRKGFKRALIIAVLKNRAPPSAPHGLWPRPQQRPRPQPWRLRRLGHAPYIGHAPSPPGSPRRGRKVPGGKSGGGSDVRARAPDEGGRRREGKMPVAVMAESSVSFRRLLEQCETQELEVRGLRVRL